MPIPGSVNRTIGARGKSWRFRCNRDVVVLAFLVGVLALCTVIPTKGSETNLANRFRQPSLRHIFGTDQFGRDVASTIIKGTTWTIVLSIVCVLLAATIGIVLGLCTGLGPRRRIAALSVSDIVVCLPTFMVALMVMSAVGPGRLAVVAVLVGLGWTPYFRLTSQLVLSLSSTQFAEAARAGGASPIRLLVRHILPNLAGQLLAFSAARVSHSIVAVSSLSFLGVGMPPPSMEWGALLASSQPYAERAPWSVLAPSLAIVVAATVSVLLGRRLQSRLAQVEPKSHSQTASIRMAFALFPWQDAGTHSLMVSALQG